MAIQRLPGPAHTVTPLQTGHTVYEVALSAAPSPAWRAAFLRPPARLTSVRGTPDFGAVSVYGATIVFRTIPVRLPSWLRRIDTWVDYANSIIDAHGPPDR